MKSIPATIGLSSAIATITLAPLFAEELDVLIFSANTQRWAHTESIQQGIETIEELGETENWNVTKTVNPSDFTNTKLADFDVIIFNNTGGDSLFDTNQQNALKAYIQAGGGYVGIHSASATEFDWQWYGELVGAFNDGHPTAQSATLTVNDATHPSSLHLSDSFDELGEWYYWEDGTDPRLKDGMKILLSLDGDSITDTSNGGIDDRAHPVAWCREFDGGRSFYTVQAHFGEVYEEDYFKTFLAEGIKWAADAVEQDGLLLDLDANKSVTLEDGNKVTQWMNQAPTNTAQVFQSTDDGRENANVSITKRGVDLLGLGSGRPTLLTSVVDLNGNNSISFVEEDLVNLEENAFDHLSHGNGYTWVAVLSRYSQRWPVEGISEVNAFFGNLRNGNPYDGIWGGFDSQNRIWSSTRTADGGDRDTTGDDWIIGPVLPEKEYFIAAGRLGAGQGNVTMDMFINNIDIIDSVPVSINPNGNPSFMAIGTERFATNHPGKESFDGEIARFLIYERPLSDLELEQTIETLKLKYLAEENSNETNTHVFNFESGDLQGAFITSGSFGEIVTDKALFNTTGDSYNKEGTYFLSTLEGPGHDEYTGTITSPEFVLTGAEASFLIGGGMSSDLSFSIHLADGTAIHSTNRGANGEPFERQTVDLAAYIGETVYWQVTDNSTAGWGYIALDDIRFDAISTFSNDFESGTLDNLIVTGNFPALLQSRDAYLVPSNYSASELNKQGDFFLSTIDNGNGGFSDYYTGVIQSNSFILRDPNASLLIGGGSESNLVYFGIYNEFNEEIIRVANSSDSETFERVSFDLSDYIGETIYWKVVDGSKGSWGFITVDDISFNGSLPISFESQDIGGVATSGSYSVSNSSHILQASGSDVWSSSDEFQFASSSLSGEGEITATVESVGDTHRWAKGGVMMRNSFAHNSQNVFVFVAPNGQATMQARSITGGGTVNHTSSLAVGTAGATMHVSLRREDDTFIGSYSEDGQTWNEINRITIAMEEEVLIGLAATSHSDGVLTTAEFSNVVIDAQ